tara:strand:+ start:924 stop:1139 length:216 start_codon:yes stop_codon:yes gene_type:complete
MTKWEDLKEQVIIDFLKNSKIDLEHLIDAVESFNPNSATISILQEQLRKNIKCSYKLIKHIEQLKGSLNKN